MKYFMGMTFKQQAVDQSLVSEKSTLYTFETCVAIRQTYYVQHWDLQGTEKKKKLICA